MSQKGSFDKHHCRKNGTVTDRTASQFDHNQLIFFLNGQRIVEKDIDPLTTLANYLRDNGGDFMLLFNSSFPAII